MFDFFFSDESVSSFGEICFLGIDSHISYFQKKPIQIGYYEQPTNSHQLYNGNSFLKRNAFGRAIGTHCEVKIEKKVLVVKFENGIVIKTLDEALECFSDLNKTEVPSLSVLVDILFQLVGVYRVRCHKKGLIKNDLVKLISSKNKRHKFVSLSDADDEKPVDVIDVTGKIDFDSFRHSYCRTGHSCQGVTIRKKYCVHDAFNKVISAHWLFPALTRGVRLSDVYINIENKQYETTEPKFPSSFGLRATVISTETTPTKVPRRGADRERTAQGRRRLRPECFVGITQKQMELTRDYSTLLANPEREPTPLSAECGTTIFTDASHASEHQRRSK